MTAARTYPARPDAVATGETATAVLASADFDVTPHIDFTAALAERLKIDLSATLNVMRHLPLWSSGAHHADMRRAVASFLAEDREGKTRRAAHKMRSAFADLIEASGPIDLLVFIRELADIFMEEVSGLPRFATDATALPSIFSSNLGVASRRGLEGALRQQFELARRIYPAESDERLALRIGQWMMGRDPLIGTLGLSLHRHLHALDGAPLCSRLLPKIPTDTGIPAIGRIARTPREVDGCPVGAGALVECRLDSFAQGNDLARRRFFGAGTHLCLGRPFALDFFEIVSAELKTCRFGLKVSEFALRADDVFDMPSVFVVTKIV